MAEKCEDSKLVMSLVDQGLHCGICQEILSEPKQCKKREHYFCRLCILRHLKIHPEKACPICKDPLHPRELKEPHRFLANVLETLRTSCEYFERGCRQLIDAKLGSKDPHVAICGFAPVSCEICNETVNRCDKELHKKNVCELREIKCAYCGEVLHYIEYDIHMCTGTRESREIKREIAVNKAEIKTIRSTQDEMLEMMKEMSSVLFAIKCNVHSAQDLHAEVVVAGGVDCTSVEAFNMSSRTWRRLPRIDSRREGACSVLYKDRMLILGGRKKDSIVSLDLKEPDAVWVNCEVKLPRASHDHACVVYQDRLYVVGGRAYSTVRGFVDEIRLAPSISTDLFTEMAEPVCCHSVELINHRAYIVGGYSDSLRKHMKASVVRLDISTKVFTELKPLPYPVAEMATVTWKGNVIVLGGVTTEGKVLDTVTLYMVKTEDSCSLPAMKQKRRGCSAVAIGDNILVMGGRDECGRILDSLDCYNFNTNTWREFPKMIESRAYGTAIVKYW